MRTALLNEGDASAFTTMYFDSPTSGALDHQFEA
jgi:hypothetical protein